MFLQKKFLLLHILGQHRHVFHSVIIVIWLTHHIYFISTLNGQTCRVISVGRSTEDASRKSLVQSLDWEAGMSHSGRPGCYIRFTKKICRFQWNDRCQTSPTQKGFEDFWTKHAFQVIFFVFTTTSSFIFSIFLLKTYRKVKLIMLHFQDLQFQWKYRDFWL